MFKAVDPVAFTIFGREIMWYGVIVALAVIAGVVVTMWRMKKAGYNPDVIIDFAFIVIPLAIVGARLYYVIFAWHQFASNPISILYIWQGGLAIYGGIIGGAIGVYLLCRRRKYKFGIIADAIAPSLAIAQSIGRWGNYFNQEAYGYAVKDINIINFPFACVEIAKTHYVEIFDNAKITICTEPYHLATFFYESVWNLIVFIALIVFTRGKKKRARGNTFALYLILYGLGRFMIEGLRADSLWLIDGVIRISQALSVVIMVAGALYIIWNNKKGRLGLDGDDDDTLPKLGEPILNAKQIKEKLNSDDTLHQDAQDKGAHTDGDEEQESFKEAEGIIEEEAPSQNEHDDELPKEENEHI